MGCCCSLFSSGGSSDRETEMQDTADSGPTEEQLKSLVVSRPMSSPNIKLKGRTQLTGHGLALCAVSIEQDAAYWEWHIQVEPGTLHIDDIMFGVASKKGRAFYKKLKDDGVTIDSSDEKTGTQFMRKIEVQNGDVVGVAVQQSDLPMVQFFLNGEALYDLAINRFRGTVYPSICMPIVAGEDKSLTTKLILIESEFKKMSPGPRFGPVIVARNIV